MIHLENSLAYVDIDPYKGARVSQFGLFSRDKKLKYPLLWSEMKEEESGWCHGGVPILFPFAGRVWSSGRLGFYHLYGRDFPMAIHGCVHNQPWVVLDHKKDSVELLFSATEDMTKMYPWEFDLRVCWTLHEKSLKYSFSVENKRCSYPFWPEKKMPFSMGLHPYFQVKPEHEKDLKVACEPKEQYAVTPEGKVGSREEWDPALPTIKKPSLILRRFQKPYIDLQLSHQPKLKVRMEMENCEQTVVMWPGATGYICVEPWMGFPDALQYPDALSWVEEGQQQTWGGAFCADISA